MSKYLQKRPMESKKFLAFLLSQLMFSVFITLWFAGFGPVITFYEALVGVVLVVCCTFMQVGYILGEAYLDKFAMVAKDLTPWGEGETLPANPPETDK